MSLFAPSGSLFGIEFNNTTKRNVNIQNLLLFIRSDLRDCVLKIVPLLQYLEIQNYITSEYESMNSGNHR